MKNYRAAGSGEPDASFVFLPDGFVREQAEGTGGYDRQSSRFPDSLITENYS